MKKGIIATLLTSLFSMVSASQVLFHMPEGEHFYLEIQDQMNVAAVKDRVGEISHYPLEKLILLSDGKILNDRETLHAYEGKEVWVELDDFSFDANNAIAKKTYAGFRDYHQTMTKDEKKDLRFLLKTMATKSLAGLLKYKSQMEYAGDRIDHVHPLRFLETVFTDEELKVFIHNIKKRGGWIWGEFIKGLKGSLQEEFDLGNLTDEMVLDFSQQVGIDIGVIEGLVKGLKWDDFVKTLIVHIPRKGDSGRYDQ